jgi:phosphomannomutase
MDTPKSIFREYDVRGIVGRELTPELAEHLGRAYATVARERVGHAPILAVGRDNRPSGDALAAGVRLGISSTGFTGIDV